LHDRFDSVDRHQEHAKAASRQRGTGCLEASIHGARRIKRVPQCQHASIGGSVAKARQRALQQRRTDAAIETATISHVSKKMTTTQKNKRKKRKK
jgi:hypothetical protein